MSAILLFATGNNSCTQNISIIPVTDTIFSFIISDFYRESSKDSHSYSKEFSLKSGVLYYDYVYSGYPDNEEKHTQKQLNDSIISLIKVKLNELSLYQNYRKEFPIDRTGMITESGYSFSVTTDTARYNIQVSGNRAIEIDDKVYEKLSEFYYFINNLFPQKD
jgi:hypothetical protein